MVRCAGLMSHTCSAPALESLASLDFLAVALRSCLQGLWFSRLASLFGDKEVGVPPGRPGRSCTTSRCRRRCRQPSPASIVF